MYSITTHISLLSHLFHRPQINDSTQLPLPKLDRTIQQELNQLGQKIWPNTYFLGIIPIHNYRLRKQRTKNALTWWIEHDIPPYDLYRCAAYQVELINVNPNDQKLTVRSGALKYPVQSLTPCALEVTLERARKDPPLHLNRAFGKVIDP